jgi:DNA-binding MarR family transcriptional regulator
MKRIPHGPAPASPDSRPAEWSADRRDYWQGIGTARFVIRKIFRIVDEQAKKLGLDPLQHQVLLQVNGSSREMLLVNQIADRLDIAPAFASKLVRGLRDRGLLEQGPAANDKRATEVRLTDEARAVLREVDRLVQFYVPHFSGQLSPDEKKTALSIFSFYVGAAPPPDRQE